VFSPHDLALLILLVIVILNQLNIKKNKIDKDNSTKKIKKQYEENTLAIHSNL
jgi:uncharacterized protein YxeA